MSKQRANGGRCHPVLPSARLGDDPLLAHPLRQQSLAQRVVDLVRTRVQQVLALQIDLCPAQFFRQPLGKIERRRTPCKILEQSGQFRLESRIRLRDLIFVLEFQQCSHQRLRHIPPAIDAKPPGARFGGNRGKNHRCHWTNLLFTRPRDGLIFSLLARISRPSRAVPARQKWTRTIFFFNLQIIKPDWRTIRTGMPQNKFLGVLAIVDCQGETGGYPRGQKYIFSLWKFADYYLVL